MGWKKFEKRDDKRYFANIAKELNVEVCPTMGGRNFRAAAQAITTKRIVVVRAPCYKRMQIQGLRFYSGQSRGDRFW